jgi:hypothetical protein
VINSGALYIYNHTTSLILEVALTRLMLRGQHCIRYENVFMSYRSRQQENPTSPHSMFVIMASRTTDMQPLPHDKDCPQARLILREWVCDSHHPTSGNLPSYFIVSVSLQNSKLHKVNTESKI